MPDYLKNNIAQFWKILTKHRPPWFYLPYKVIIFMSMLITYTGEFVMADLTKHDLPIKELKNVEWRNLYSIPLNIDASGYEGLTFKISGKPGKGRVYLVDFDKDDWYAEFDITDSMVQHYIRFDDFNPCHANAEPHFDMTDLKNIRFESYDMIQETRNLKDVAFWGSKGVYGPTVCVDPLFDFYKSKTWSQWADVFKDYGFTAIDLVIIRDWPDIDYQKDMVKSFQDKGIFCRLRLYPTTDWGAYEHHPEWRQKLLGGSSQYDWRVYLCPSDEKFVKYMENKIESLCKNVPYDGIQLAEPWFEVWGGAYKNNPTRDYYACLCDDCRSTFKLLEGIDPLRLFIETDELYFEKSENKELYEKWVTFRVNSIISFSKNCYEAAKRVRPEIKVVHMYLADCTVQLDASREYQAMDLERSITEIRPDMITIEDSWQDWTQPDLKPDFILSYGKAYYQRIRNINPDMKIQSHNDIGSRHDTKRDYNFMRAFSTYSRRAGFDSPSYYEFSIQDFEILSKSRMKGDING